MKRWPLFCVAVLLLAASAPRHGIEVGIQWRAPALIATCTWSGGAAVAGAVVEVYSPDDGEEAHQRGETDVNGLFAFVPDRAGEWRFVVDDGMGHRKEAVFSLPPDFRAREEITVDQEDGRVLPVVGLVALAGLVVIIVVVSLRRAG